MGAFKNFWIELQNVVENKILVSKRKKYWVFRRYRQVQPDLLSGKYRHIKEIPPPETWPVVEDFALHFIEPFSTRKAAREAIRNAKIIATWQEFFIIKS